ncbi:MAG TPA: multicopper oxidase domain-containing protein [Bryobacteraceae bacterium]|nr:multicopper oxidase domain-containing protein [Bryobacteraceae bacterium]
MDRLDDSRRRFLKSVAGTAGVLLMSSGGAESKNAESTAAEYTLRIAASPVEIAPKRIISTVTYNGQFPGPLLRFKEGREVTVDVFNDTNTPEQLHWHGQMVPTSIDGAAEEGTPYIPAHGKRRLVLSQDRRVFVSVTRITARERIFKRDNTAGKPVRCTSSRRTSPADTIKRSFSFSRSSSPRSASEATWQRIFFLRRRR